MNLSAEGAWVLVWILGSGGACTCAICYRYVYATQCSCDFYAPVISHCICKQTGAMCTVGDLWHLFGADVGAPLLPKYGWEPATLSLLECLSSSHLRLGGGGACTRRRTGPPRVHAKLVYIYIYIHKYLSLSLYIYIYGCNISLSLSLSIYIYICAHSYNMWTSTGILAICSILGAPTSTSALE